MATADKATRTSDFSRDRCREDSVDRDIAALRLSVEGEALRPKEQASNHPQAPPRAIHVIRPPDEPTRRVPVPGGLVSFVSRARRFVRKRRFDVVVYGVCVGVTVAVVLVAVSVGAR